MLFLATPWTFDPGQLSALRPGANVMVLETVAVFTELIVSVQLVRFLWGLQRHTAVAKGTDIDQPRNLAKSVTVE